MRCKLYKCFHYPIFDKLFSRGLYMTRQSATATPSSRPKGCLTFKLRKSPIGFEMASHFLAEIIRQTSQLTSNEEDEEGKEGFSNWDDGNKNC